MLGYLEVPESAIPPVPETLFVDKTLGAMTCSASASVSGATTTMGFPRTYAIAISGDSNHDQWLPPTPYSGQVSGHQISNSGFFPISSYDNNPCAWCGRFDAALISLDWEGSDSSGAYDRALMVDAIKQICFTTSYQPSYVFQYFIMESEDNAVEARNGALIVQINSSNWWLYSTANATGTMVEVSTHPYYETNWTISYPNGSYGVAADTQFNKNFTTAHYDGSNEDYPQFAAAYVSDVYFIRQTSVTTVVDGTIAAAQYEDPRFHPLASGYSNNDAMKAPNLDGLWTDNIFIRPYWTGYYNLQTSDASGSYTSETCPWLIRGYQHAHERFLQIMAKAYPSRTYLPGGNLASWDKCVANLGASGFQTTAAGLANFVQHGMLEGIIGASYSLEAAVGTVKTIEAYQTIIDFLVGPKILAFMGFVASTTDFQNIRYILACCLMADGYCCLNIGQVYTINNCPWPDEYGGNPGTNIAKWWLGQRNGSRPTAAAINGVWVADFQHGTVLLNPKGNGSQTITNTQLNNYLHSAYNFSFIKGTQNPSLNTGNPMTSITLAAGDGGFLTH